MATVRDLLVIVCLVVIGRGWYTGSGVLMDGEKNKVVRSERLQILSIAQKELGVREATGRNDGIRVAEYLAAAGVKVSAPWCAAFVSWTYQQAGYAMPSTGWSPALFPASKLVAAPSPGIVLGIYFPDLKRIAHCGLVEKIKGNWVYSIEGNTNVEGSREGDGVYKRMRHKRSVYKYADWTRGIK